MRSFVASGAAGCVIKPALSNVKNDKETPEHFTDQVTKIYYDIPDIQNSVEEADKAVATNEGLAAMGFPRLVHPYRKKWRTNEMPPEIKKLPGDPCRIKRENAPVGVTHMPNLGIDFMELQMAYWDSIVPEHPTQKSAQALMDKVRSVPFETIMVEGIYPMLNALLILKKNNKIHRDIRLENSMFNPNTGQMTLIDFDRMTDQNKITDWKIPSRLMVAYTPEMALWESQRSKEESEDLTKRRNEFIRYILRPDRSFSKIPDRHDEIIRIFEPILAIWKGQLHLLIQLHRLQYKRSSMNYLFDLNKETAYHMADFVLMEMGNYMDELTEEKIMDDPSRKERVKLKSAPTIDSLCMAFCLMVFLGVYLDEEKWATHAATLDPLFEKVLIPLYKFSIYKYHPTHSRADIEDVFEEFTKLLPVKAPPKVYRQQTLENMLKFPLIRSAGVKRARASSATNIAPLPKQRTDSTPGFGSTGGTRRKRSPRGLPSRKKLKSRRSTKRVRRRA